MQRITGVSPVASFKLWPILLAGLIVGCAETPSVSNVMPPRDSTRIYVANEGSNTVSVIDGDTFKPVGEIESLNYATHDLALTRDGRKLFATNLASGAVSVIETPTLQTVASIYTGKRSHVVAITNDGKHAWVANIADGTVSIVETVGYRVLGVIPVPQAMGITFSQDGQFAYVSSMNKTVSVVDVAAHQIIETIPVGTNPHFLVLAPNGYIWGTNTGQNDVFVIDPKENKVVGTLEVGQAPQQITFGYKGTTGPLAYISVGGLNKVVTTLADPKNLKIRDQIEVGEEPNGIWSNPVGSLVYVAHSKSNDLRVIDTATSQVLATVPLGRKPIRVVVSR
jgi:YVTN family beta-propeller protein